MRSFARLSLVGLLIGVVSVGTAYSGVLLGSSLLGEGSPVAGGSAPMVPGPLVAEPAAATAPVDGIVLTPEEIPAAASMQVSAPTPGRLPEGRFLVGAARASLVPAPALFGGQTWQREGCTQVRTPPSQPTIDADHALPNVDPADPVGSASEIRGWPAASPDCIYLGGFGIGPVRPAERVGQGGVWVRTVAISNGERTFIYTIADTVGWFARYDSLVCADCGILDVRERLANDLGLGVGDVIIGSTHTHAGADTYGGWGGIPDWYRDQLRDAAIASAKQAVANMVPATIEIGEVHLRDRNNERRDTYYSTVDTGVTWLQARQVRPPKCTVRCTRVIATWATYAGHPTIVEDPILHADWPGAAARRFESLWGGVGLVFEGGLGNAAISEESGATQEEAAELTGVSFADSVAAYIRHSPMRLRSNEMAEATRDITHPAETNPGLITLASVGLFDREFTPGTKGSGAPGVYHWSRAGEVSSSGEDDDPEANGAFLQGCVSSGPTVHTTAGAHRIGDLIVAFAPGEIFSNIAEVVKELGDNSAVTMVLGQTNDALGYIIQSFEYDTEGGGAAGEYATTHGEYEEVFAIDRCFGDHVLETILESTRALGAGG